MPLLISPRESWRVNTVEPDDGFVSAAKIQTQTPICLFRVVLTCWDLWVMSEVPKCGGQETMEYASHPNLKPNRSQNKSRKTSEPFEYDTSADKFILRGTTTGNPTDSCPRHAGLSLCILLPLAPAAHRTRLATHVASPPLLIIAKPSRILKRSVCNVELGFSPLGSSISPSGRASFLFSCRLFRFSFLLAHLFPSLPSDFPPRLHGWDSHAHTVFSSLLFFPFLDRSCRAALLVLFFSFYVFLKRKFASFSFWVRSLELPQP